MIERALNDWTRLRPLCRADSTPFISVNLSADELMNPKTPDLVSQTLTRHGCDPSQLHLELTETMLVSQIDPLLAAVQRLLRAGVNIALDVFGTGYAGLDHLQKLPFSRLKIDKTFVLGMRSSERSLQIVRSALELSRALGMASVAEGVEDADSLVTLRDLGCDFVQGYHLGRPLPLAQVLASSDSSRTANAAA